jgi:hypothetical protein
MGLEEDLPPDVQLPTSFLPFLEHLAASNLSPKTIQKHVDNMLGAGWGIHSQSPQRLFSAKEASAADPPSNDRGGRSAPLSRRRRSAEMVRFDLPKVPAIPQRTASPMLAVTHKFPRRGTFKAFEGIGEAQPDGIE